jgi:hypothetical protein
MSRGPEIPKGQFGPLHPSLGAAVEKFRRRARVVELSCCEKQRYGEAVEVAVRALQRTELMRCLTSTPSSDRPSIPRPPNPCAVKYSTPNPFPMAGDPLPTQKEMYASQRDRPAMREERLYAHAMKPVAGILKHERKPT